MKKFGTVLLTIGMLAVVCAPATYAASYRESVTAKAAPAVTENKIVDAEGNEIALKEDEAVTVVSVADAATAEELSEEVKAALTEATTELAEKPVSELEVENLDTVISIVAEDKTADDFEVRDLFDIDVPETISNALDNGGAYTATFAVGTEADTALIVMTKCPGQGWVAVPAENVVNNGDGTVTVTFTALCPIAFLSEIAEDVALEDETSDEEEAPVADEETEDVAEDEDTTAEDEEVADEDVAADDEDVAADDADAEDEVADEEEDAAPAEEADASAADAETNPNSGVDFGTTMLYIAGAALAMAGAAVLGFSFRKASKTK